MCQGVTNEDVLIYLFKRYQIYKVSISHRLGTTEYSVPCLKNVQDRVQECVNVFSKMVLFDVLFANFNIYAYYQDRVQMELVMKPRTEVQVNK